MQPVSRLQPERLDCFCRYTTLSFALVGLAGDSVGLSIVTNGLPASAARGDHPHDRPSRSRSPCRKSMTRMGQVQAEIDEVLGNIALVFEVFLAVPAIALLMRNPSLEAALSSASRLLGLEVPASTRTWATAACATRATP